MIFFAITTIGAIAVPLNAWWTGAERAYGIRDSGAKLLIVDSERHDRLREHRDAMPGVEQWLVARGGTAIDGATALAAHVGDAKRWTGLTAGDRPRNDLDRADQARHCYRRTPTPSPKESVGAPRNQTASQLSGGEGKQSV